MIKFSQWKIANQVADLKQSHIVNKQLTNGFIKLATLKKSHMQLLALNKKCFGSAGAKALAGHESVKTMRLCTIYYWQLAT